MSTPADTDVAKMFFSAYFHEDWVEEAPNDRRVVANDLSESHPSEELASLCRGIRYYLDTYVSDTELERVLFQELGCYYMPSAEQKSAREWLEDLVAQINDVGADHS